MSGFGLKILVINSNTTAEARESNRNMWLEARTEGSVIILSPEELQNPEFRRLIDHADFAKRICKLGVDEIHLLHWWGKSFRTTFQQIGLSVGRSLKNGWFSFFLFCRTWGQGVAVCARGVLKAYGVVVKL